VRVSKPAKTFAASIKETFGATSDVDAHLAGARSSQLLKVSLGGTPGPIFCP